MKGRMNDSEEDFVSTPPQQEEKLGLEEFSSSSSSSSSPSSPSCVPATDLHHDHVNAEVENLVIELQNIGLEDKETENEDDHQKEDETEEIEKRNDEDDGDKEDENEDKNDTVPSEIRSFEEPQIHDYKSDSDNIDGESVVEEEENASIVYPQRPNQPDCPYYLRTGTCKFGQNCKFNHPAGRKNQVGKEKEKEELPERAGLLECKYYLRTGGCKFGNACRYNHSEKFVVEPALDFNFLGLPIRPGEKECPFYMRTGSCKYSINCRFHHPEPTAMGGCDPHTGFLDGGSVSFQSLGTSQPAVASWSLQRSSNETVPYLDAPSPFVPVVLPPPQGVHLNLDYGYQGPVYSPDVSIYPPSNLALNNPTKKAEDALTHHQQQILVEEFPERPGQPECSYFMKNGDCKFRSACRYHHPKIRESKSLVCTLSPMGLPLRPDQSICTHYNRYGICKFGPACKFDHPIHHGSVVSSARSPALIR